MIARNIGFLPSRIGSPGVFVAVLIGVTVPGPVRLLRGGGSGAGVGPRLAPVRVGA